MNAVVPKLWLPWALLAMLIIVQPTPAFAWYFPEHAELTRLALRDFASHEVTLRITHVVADARQAGLALCPEAISALHAVPTSGDNSCVPYGALAALAGDHSNRTIDLRESLSVPVHRLSPAPNRPLGVLLTEAAQNTWNDFQQSAPAEAIRIWTQQVSRLTFSNNLVSTHALINPRDFVRKLDADLYVIDTGYVTRAKNAKTHFHDPTSAVETVLIQASLGFADNALAQAIAHHARSLQLAVSSRSAPLDQRAQMRIDALLEHGFALHFIEDGFAAGHVATDPAVASPERRAQRHDYFNRQGLAVTRALARRRCSEFDTPSPARTLGLPPCWVAQGDGFVAAQDRWYVGEAVARVQTAFAIALEGLAPGWLDHQMALRGCAKWKGGKRGGRERPDESCDAAWIAMALDPHPEWLNGHDASKHDDDTTNENWAREIIEKFEEAVQLLAASKPLTAADAGLAQAQPGILSREILGHPLEPADDPCSVPQNTEWLWCPVLASWPEAQADVASLEGTDSFGRGFEFQLLASTVLSDSQPLTEDGLLALSGGIGAGVALMTQGLFADRGARSMLELNAGIGQGVALYRGERQFPQVVVFEVRAPVTTLLLYAAGMLWRSRALLSGLGEGVSVGLFGGRVYWTLNAGRPLPNAWDVEVVNILLKRGPTTSAAAAGFLDTEGRIRLGARSQSLTTGLEGIWHGGEFLVSFEVNGGYFF